MQGVQDRVPRGDRHGGVQGGVSCEVTISVAAARSTCALFARIHEVARLGALAPRLANLLSHAPGLGAIARRTLECPSGPRAAALRRANVSFVVRGRMRGAGDSTAREVVLFPDTFNNFFRARGRDRRNRGARARGLQGRDSAGAIYAAGGRCTTPGCSIARDGASARRSTRWRRCSTRGAALVGLEPSCLLTFRDELPGLFPGDPRAATLSARAMLFDEFLSREAPAFVAPSANTDARWCTGIVIRSRSPG